MEAIPQEALQHWALSADVVPGTYMQDRYGDVVDPTRLALVCCCVRMVGCDIHHRGTTHGVETLRRSHQRLTSTQHVPYATC
jgi:hypothetical protein